MHINYNIITKLIKCWFLQVLDPAGNIPISLSLKSALQNVFNPRFKYQKNQNWDILYPTRALSEGSMALQCGPFICYYAEALLNGWTLEEMPNVDDYRNHIINTLIGNCALNVKKRNKCIRCGKSADIVTKCNFCGATCHESCLNAVGVRGRQFNIC